MNRGGGRGGRGGYDDRRYDDGGHNGGEKLVCALNAGLPDLAMEYVGIYYTSIWPILLLFGIFYGYLVHFSVLGCCTKKNLATLSE
jgi:hypothetical protein